MWVNPKYAHEVKEERQPRKAPVPTGRHIATIDRPGYMSEPNEQFRVYLDAMNGGRLYISLRIWGEDRNGDWWPGKAGISIRAREGEDVIEAIRQALALIHDPLIEAQIHRHNAAVKDGHAGEPVDYSPKDPASTPPQPVRARVTSSTATPARGPTRRAALTHQRQGQPPREQPSWMWNGKDADTRPDRDLSTRTDFDEG